MHSQPRNTSSEERINKLLDFIEIWHSEGLYDVIPHLAIPTQLCILWDTELILQTKWLHMWSHKAFLSDGNRTSMQHRWLSVRNITVGTDSIYHREIEAVRAEGERCKSSRQLPRLQPISISPLWRAYQPLTGVSLLTQWSRSCQCQCRPSPSS